MRELESTVTCRSESSGVIRFLMHVVHIGLLCFSFTMPDFSLMWKIFLQWLLYFSVPKHQNSTSSSDCVTLFPLGIYELAGESLLKAPWGLRQSSPIPHRTINRLWGWIKESVHSGRPPDKNYFESDINVVWNISVTQSMLDPLCYKHQLNMCSFLCKNLYNDIGDVELLRMFIKICGYIKGWLFSYFGRVQY